MKKILLLSDTHSHIDESIIKYVKQADEVWHAGDIGDLNVTMWSTDYEVLERGTGLRNARKGFGILATWSTNLPFMMIPIDHCLLSSEFKVDSINTAQDIGSDHLPIVVTLRLKAD